ncbi:MAG: hypothetical protein V4437_00695 [Patescibacteria group bacterium]
MNFEGISDIASVAKAHVPDILIWLFASSIATTGYLTDPQTVRERKARREARKARKNKEVAE